MLNAERDGLKRRIHELAREHGGDRGALIPILHTLQSEQGHVSDYAMQELADALELHPAAVYGVVTFYGFFEREPRGRFVVRLCRTISCDMQGKSAIARQLRNDLGIEFGETTADGAFSLQWCNCLGMCDQGPALLVNNRVHTSVTPTNVAEIIDDCLRDTRGPRRAIGGRVTQ